MRRLPPGRVPLASWWRHAVRGPWFIGGSLGPPSSRAADPAPLSDNRSVAAVALAPAAVEPHAAPRPPGRRSWGRLAWRRWMAVTCLVVLPVLVYWPTIFARYGFRDDYSILRESHEEPGKVVRVCAMQARPLDGVLLQASFRLLRGIDDLRWLRLLSAVLMGAAGAALFASLCASRWEPTTAALAGALVGVLPAAQIVVGWAVGWPLGLALILAVAAFWCAERGADFGRSGVAAALWTVAAVVLVAAATLIYQPNSVFYFTVLAGALWPRRRMGAAMTAAWALRHALVVFAGAALALTSMLLAFSQRWVAASPRVALDHDWWGKVCWFALKPLQNAFGLEALNDDAGSPLVPRCAMLVAVVVLAGLLRLAWTRRRGAGFGWFGLVLLTMPASFAANLVVADRWPAYRVLLPLSATVLILLSMGLLSLAGRTLVRLTLVALLAGGAWLARQHTYDLIARPQRAELRLIEEVADRIDPAATPRVFLITPRPEDHAGPRVFLDEFGSLSTDSDWVPKEMLKLVMQERHPGLPDLARRYSVVTGRTEPADDDYDVVADLRRIRDLGTELE